MGGPKNTTQRSVVRASKDQRKLLFLAYDADKTPSKPRLDGLGDQTGLSPDWISRWFARQRRSDKKRAAQGCIDLTVKRELLDEDPTAAVPQSAPVVDPCGTRKPARRRLKKCVKKEETPEAPPLPMSSPSLRWSSPMLPSSSPPRTPTHIPGPAQAWVYGDALSSPAHLHTRAYSYAGDCFLRPLSADPSKSQIMKDEDAQETFWLSSFTCRTAPGSFPGSGNTIRSPDPPRERTGPIGHEPASAVSGIPSASGPSSTRASGSAAPAARLDQFDDAIAVYPIPHGDSSASRGKAFYQSSVVSPTLLHVLRFF
ncbi:hypothetical protein LXA43DRAFT_995057 [Ganoderma leucocontextum]|nr:hypothetical protein LXA43DRAFT_995057 [Ganoderma leucocontextum]